MGAQQTNRKNNNYVRPRVVVDKNSIEENMKKISQALLETYLFGKKYDESKVKQWGDDIIHFLSGTLNWHMHNETEGKLTLRLIPTPKDPYTGLVYREDR